MAIKKTFLLEIFKGLVVNVTMKDLMGSSSNNGDFINLTITGYMLDEDDRFVYLGSSEEEISCALAKEQIVTVILDTAIPEQEVEIEVPEGSPSQ